MKLETATPGNEGIMGLLHLYLLNYLHSLASYQLQILL